MRKCHSKCTNKNHVLDILEINVSHNWFIYIIKTVFLLVIFRRCWLPWLQDNFKVGIVIKEVEVIMYTFNTSKDKKEK